jgi:DNA-binding MarR family transcriptional regulator
MTKRQNTSKRRTRSGPSRGKLDTANLDTAAAIGSTTSIKIIRIAEALNRSAARIFGSLYDLKNTDFRILGNLFEPSPVTIGELSRRVRIDKAWISRSLGGLVERKLIRITSTPAQPRAKLIGLTARGKAMLAEIEPVIAKRAIRILAGVDRELADVILDRISENVRQLEDEELGQTTGATDD